ncbi:MAG: hypothetical protein ACRDO4_11180 [Nocardioides sp.]
MHRIASVPVLALAAASLVAVGTPAHADSSPNSALKCFSGGTGSVCDADGNDVHLASTGSADNMSFAGVYINSNRMTGHALADVDYSFDWSGTVTGGAPRFSIAVDTDGDGAGNGFATLDAVNCAGTASSSGTVSTDAASCHVYTLSLDDDGANPAGYANWDAFAAAHPDWTIARDTSFAIVDWASDVQLTGVTFQVS